jgi:hypothetical protein
MMTLVDDVRVYDGHVYFTDWAEAAGYDVEALVLDGDARPDIEDKFFDWAEENDLVARLG